MARGKREVVRRHADPEAGSAEALERRGEMLGGVVVAVSGVVAAVVMTRVRRLTLEPHLVRRRPHVHVHLPELDARVQAGRPDAPR